jgi:hypothetical protein
MSPFLNRLAALLLASLLSILGGTRLWADEPRLAPAPLADGPYVLWEGAEAKVLSVQGGKRVESRLAAPYELDLPGLGSLRLDPRPPAPSLAVFPLPDRLAAVSDIHGNVGGLVALLQAHGVIDGRRNWSFGTGHFLVLGDMFDRGAQVTEVLWLLHRLETQAKVAGGRVHVLLGNHDVGAFRGDERYLHPNYEYLQKQVLGTNQQALYGPASELGRWLRSRPVLLRIGPFLFAHGGPSPDMCDEERQLEAFNGAFRKAIDQEGQSRLLGKASPIWYRGLIPGRAKQREEADSGDIERLRAAFGIRTLVVGHSTLKQGITAFHEGRVHGIDADLQSGAPGELWLYRNGACFRGLRDGSVLLLELAGPLR